ncbi:MAG: hypothetical protein P8P30_10075 [Rickettsiales bacterium]|nr:hypothetical protein [Rickettsiales bacterium]
MGNYASMRWEFHTAKTTVEELLCFDIDEMVKRKFIRWQRGCKHTLSWLDNCGNVLFSLHYDCYAFHPESAHINLKYDSIHGQHDYDVKLSHTVPHFGGVRIWVHCPNCQKRCRKLYLCQESLSFICRGCGNFAYESQQMRPFNRIVKRMYGIAGRLGDGGSLHPPPKPKGMPWLTYDKLSCELAKQDMRARALFGE